MIGEERIEEFRKALLQYLNSMRITLTNMTREVFARVYQSLKQTQAMIVELQSNKLLNMGEASRYWRRYWAVALGLCKERACKKKRRLRRERRKP